MPTVSVTADRSSEHVLHVIVMSWRRSSGWWVGARRCELRVCDSDRHLLVLVALAGMAYILMAYLVMVYLVMAYMTGIFWFLSITSPITKMFLAVVALADIDM